MCGSDSGADTRDSESTLPASLADEREKGRGWKIYRDRKKTEVEGRTGIETEGRSRNEPSFKH